jgi:predicted phosphoadenosine phosphosulfate sulfurtransferase
MNVLEAANERLRVIFEDFDNVLVAFSCGKDSGVLLNLAYRYASDTGQLSKLGYYYEDYEACYRTTSEYAERTFKGLAVERRYWLCLPISAACSVSMYEPRWIPWDEDKRAIWVRPMPTGEYVVNADNCPYPFAKGTKGFDARIQFSEWYAKCHGRTAVLIGLRAQESLTRRAIFTSKARVMMHKNLRYSKVLAENLCNFYPIYDWWTEDIWTANAKFGFDYNKIYDLYYQAGLTVDQMRVASPFHQSGQNDLKLYRAIDPNNWGRMVGRVNGCNFGGIYGGTSAMGWRKIKKPGHFTWRQYAEFLISTLPEVTQKKMQYHVTRLWKDWREKGRGRNPQVIATMEKEGLTLQNTKVRCKRCTKPNIYEVVKIQSEDFLDETSIPMFRLCPSWKAICVAIMKNDYTGIYLGCARTKDQNIMKQHALERYGRLSKSREAQAQ